MEDAIQAKISPPISVCLLDARRAVQFVRLHAAEWNLDPQRIAVARLAQREPRSYHHLMRMARMTAKYVVNTAPPTNGTSNHFIMPR